MTVVFSTPGLIPIEAFTFFGMSAKPNSRNPIGKFGTGLKNTVAIILRLGGSITVMIGSVEYVFYLRERDFRGQTFQEVRMKKRQGIMPWSYHTLPFTTELGKHWEPWMALRELEANTRDEGGESFVTSRRSGQFSTSDDKTLIIVECREVEQARLDMHTVFVDEEKHPVISEVNGLRIRRGPSNFIFYRGLRVTDLRKPSRFCYDFERHVELTEDRTSRYPFLDKANIRRALMEAESEEISSAVVSLTEEDWESDLDWDQETLQKPAYSSGPSSSFIAALTSIPPSSIKSPRLATMRRRHESGIPGSTEVSVDMPARLWQQLLDHLEGALPSHEALIQEALDEAGWKNITEEETEDA